MGAWDCVEGKISQTTRQLHLKPKSWLTWQRFPDVSCSFSLSRVKTELITIKVNKRQMRESNRLQWTDTLMIRNAISSCQHRESGKRLKREDPLKIQTRILTAWGCWACVFFFCCVWFAGMVFVEVWVSHLRLIIGAIITAALWIAWSVLRCDCTWLNGWLLLFFVVDYIYLYVYLCLQSSSMHAFTTDIFVKYVISLNTFFLSPIRAASRSSYNCEPVTTQTNNIWSTLGIKSRRKCKCVFIYIETFGSTYNHIMPNNKSIKWPKCLYVLFLMKFN